MFKIKCLKYNQLNKVVKKELICYVNFRLFDHLKRLKTVIILITKGIHKINMWDNENLTVFSDDSYFKWSENFNKKSTHIYFEIESFMRPVVYNNISRNKAFNNPNSFNLNIKDQQKIYEILERSPFEELTSYDKRTIWSNRYALTQIESAVPFIFSCVDYRKKVNIK